MILTHSTECGTECAPDCPAREIDLQSGQSVSVALRRPDIKDKTGRHNYGHGLQPERPNAGHNDNGGASRFFAQPEWSPGDYLASVYTPKAGKRERNAGLDGMPEATIGAKGNGLARACATCGASVLGGCACPDRTYINPARANHHPTVKPVALMRYLIRLVTPPGGTVLDPFLGSGTTAVAAILEGFEWIGCELTEEYLPIIAARCQWARENIEIPEPTLFDEDMT